MYSPSLVGLELVRGCNFQCRMCPVPDFMPNKSFTFMSDEVIDWTIEQIKAIPTIGHVYLFNFGEPMAHPKFVSIIEKMQRELGPVRRERGLFVEMFTNGSLLSGAKAEVLLETTILSQLVLSFDGYGDKQSFEAMRGPWYDRVLQNMEAFGAMARSRRPDLKLLTNSIVPQEQELHLGRAKTLKEAKQDLVEVFEPLGFSVNVKRMHNYAGDVDLPLKADNLAIVPKASCHNVECDQVFVSGNGMIMPCCSSMDEGLAVGRWDSGESLAAVCNGAAMGRLRHLLRTDRRGEIEQCKSCLNSISGSNCHPSISFPFWMARHGKHPITDAEERRVIFGEFDPDGGLNADPGLLRTKSVAASERSGVAPAAWPAVAGEGVTGYLDSMVDDGEHLLVTGWAGSLESGRAFERLLLIGPDGPTAPAAVEVLARPTAVEVFGLPGFLYAGFTARFPRTVRDPVKVLAQVDGAWGELTDEMGLSVARARREAGAAGERDLVAVG